MRVPLITTASQFAKQWSLKTRWKLKKDSGNFSAHYTSLRDTFAQVPSPEERRMGEITAKVQAGAKLTGEEMEFLRQKNPQLYMKLKAIEEEQREYEEELRRCKTQDQVQRLHMAKAVQSLEQAKQGDATALYRLNRLTESKDAFVKSGEYRELPTEQEEALVRSEIRQERQEALQEELEEAESRTEEAAEGGTTDGETEEIEEIKETDGERKEAERKETGGETKKAGAKEAKIESPAHTPEKPNFPHTPNTPKIKPDTKAGRADRPAVTVPSQTAAEKPALAALYRQAETETPKKDARKHVNARA